MNDRPPAPLGPSISTSLTRDIASQAWQGLSPNEQVRLTELLDEAMAAMAAGEAVAWDRLASRHPELAEALREVAESLTCLYTPRSASLDSPPTEDDDGVARRVGNYQLLRELGRGGMGVVYEAEDVLLQRRVAVKLLPFAAVLDPKQVARFRNEALAAGQLHHPHIVPVYAVGSDRGVHYFAMQLIEGQPLDVALEELRAQSSRASTGEAASSSAVDRSTSPWRTFSTEGGARNPAYVRTVAQLGADVADALQHAHEVGILHRDMKPANLLLDRRGKIWVSDFGLAHVPSGESMTMTGDILGTVRYMSPEQARGQTQFVDQRSDIYSLGVTLYELLTLRKAVDAENRDALLAQLAADPSPPRSWNSAIPVDLETIVLKAMEREPSARYASAADLAEDLRRFLAGKPTLARRPRCADRLAKWARRHRRWVAALAMGLVGITVISFGMAWRLDTQQRKTQAALSAARTQFHQARRLLDQLGLDVAYELQQVPGSERVRRRILLQAVGYYRDFLEQSDAVDAEWLLRSELAEAHHQTGRLLEELGDWATSRRHYDAAIQLYERQLREEDVDHEPGELAKCFNNRGLLHWRQGDRVAAQHDLERSLEWHAASFTRSDNGAPHDPAWVEAASAYATALGNRALIFQHDRAFVAARKCLEQAVELQRAVVRVRDTPHGHQRLAVSLHNLASLLPRETPEAGRRLCQEATALLRALVDRDPYNITLRRDLGLSHGHAGALAHRTGHMEQALAAYGQAVEAAEWIVDRVPQVVDYQVDVAIARNNLGRAHLERADFKEAAASFAEARQVLEALIETVGVNPELLSLSAGVAFNRGIVAWRQSDSAAEAWFQQANQQMESALKASQGGLQILRDFDQQLTQLARYYEDAGRYSAALQTHARRQRLWQGHADAPPSLSTIRARLETAMFDRHPPVETNLVVGPLRPTRDDLHSRSATGRTDTPLTEDAIRE